MAREPGLLDQLRRICGDEHVVSEQTSLRTYESDGLTQYAVRPRAAVLPGSAEQVQEVVRLCHRLELPWVARGAGTGLSAGALPVADGVLIVLARLRRVLEVDLDNRCLVVEPGVTNVDVGNAAGDGFLYPPDPSSQIVCSIGGNVAENAGGPRCFKYGFTTNYVIGLEVVLSDGELVRLGGKEVDRPGYDLLGAFVGSEGTLGIATKIWVRIVPAPEAVATMVGYFRSIEAAGNAVSAIVASGVVPAAIELMDRLTLEATAEIANHAFPEDAAAALIVELDGPRENCDLTADAVLEILAREGASETRQRRRRGRARPDLEGAQGRLRRDGQGLDQLLRAGRGGPADEAGRGAGEHREARARTRASAVANVFHAGDGNLHPLICYDGATPGEAERAEELAGRILDLCVSSGGSITGEHGVGLDKRKHMPKLFDAPDLDLFHRLRCAFDPTGLVNPGKVMPTPRLCGEVPGPYRAHPLEREGVIERI